MNEETVTIKTNDGDMKSFTFWPDATGPFAPVVLFMDAPGIREELFDFCRRIAEQGYFVLLPDMYYRLGELRFDYAQLGDESLPFRKQMFDAMGSLSNKLVMDDTRAMLDFLAANPNAKDGPKGCIGYCMSGQYVVSAPGTYPDHFMASASLYGVSIVTDQEDSPHLLALNIKGELYFGFAETDEYVPDNVIPTLQTALNDNNVAHKLDIWPGTEHGFCFPQRPLYKEDAAEQVWTLVFDMFKRQLG